jgi:hypothetical protein
VLRLLACHRATTSATAAAATTATYIWVYMLSRGSRLEVTWVAGTQMITSGTDGLSRKRWAEGHHWSFRQAALEKLLDWARHSGQVLTTLTCEVIVQQLTTHNKHQFHDSQSSSHHTKQTLHDSLWATHGRAPAHRSKAAGWLAGWRCSACCLEVASPHL